MKYRQHHYRAPFGPSRREARENAPDLIIECGHTHAARRIRTEMRLRLGFYGVVGGKLRLGLFGSRDALLTTLRELGFEGLFSEPSDDILGDLPF